MTTATECPQAELPAESWRGPGFYCHSVICRLTSEADERSIGERVQTMISWLCRDACESLLPNTGKARSSESVTNLYVEYLPYPSTSAIASRLRARETSRQLSGDAGQVLRATILSYNDSVRDFVLVGDRSVLDQCALYRVAAYCLSSGERPNSIEIKQKPSVTELDIDVLLGSDFSPSVPWGNVVPESGQDILEIPAEGAVVPEIWLSALGWILSRFYEKTSPAVACLQEEISPSDVVRIGTAEYRLVNLPSDSDASVAGVLEHSLAQLHSAPFYTDGLVSSLKKRSESPVDVGVGVLFPLPLQLESKYVLSSEYIPYQSPVFPISLVFGAFGGSLTCYFDKSVHSASSIEWFLHCLNHVAGQLAHREAGRLADITLMSEEWRRKVVTLGQSETQPVSKPRRIEEAIQRISTEQPEEIALTYNDDELTYRQLDRLSNRFANVLLARGVSHQSFVGVCLERSTQMVVVMLAVLKCGAVYVPMDPNYPDERLEYTALDAGLILTITEGDGFPSVPGMANATIADLSGEADSYPDTPPGVVGSDADAAYMIYTSGSTGRPKGVLIPHKNVLSLIGATKHGFALSCRDTWTLFHSSAFDFSVWEIWGCLLTGGRLVVVPHWVSRDPDEFRALITRYSVTILNQTPSAFYQLIEADQRERVSDTLRLVIFGGEPLDPQALLPWFDRHPETQCRIVNMFGITETTVHVTWQDVRRHEAVSGSRSVGRAIPGWHVYVMDDNQQLLPPGVAGEIYVAGAGVAMRYHGKPDLTEERFLPNPFGGGTMYRSGDRGCLLPCGNLEHLGRLDSQIKLRGFRIELDEIRRVILGYAGVNAAAVLFHQPDMKDVAFARIDAYVVAEGVTALDIRSHVSRFLPEHMVPSSFTFVSKMPLTANGKLDAKRLPPADMSARTVIEVADKDQEAPSDMMETMVSIWEEVFGRNISVDDNFFDLGGNSLLSVRIASAINERGLSPLSMRELYTHQTIRKLVAALD